MYIVNNPTKRRARLTVPKGVDPFVNPMSSREIDEDKIEEAHLKRMQRKGFVTYIVKKDKPAVQPPKPLKPKPIQPKPEVRVEKAKPKDTMKEKI